MKQRTLLLLAGATAVVAVTAILTLRGRESAVRPAEGEERLFPDLAATVNDAAEITVERKTGSYTLRRAGEGWGLAEKGGYPVDMPSVRKTLITLSEMKRVEPKTDDPALYERLGVQDPSAEGSASALLTVKDGAGKTLASLVVGKAREGKSFSGPKQVYVRKPGEARSWLAEGELDLHEKATDWVLKKIVEVKRDRVREVEVRHADGEVLRVDRPKPEEANFTLHEIPLGRELSYPTVPGSITSALEFLNLEDVVPAAEVDMSEGTLGTTKYACFDGLVVKVTTKEVDGKTYARFEAAFETPTESAGPPTPEPSPEEAAKPAEGEDEGPTLTVVKPPKKTPEEVRQEVEELNARFASWVYVIPGWSRTNLTKRMSEMLKPLPTAEDPAAPHSPDDGHDHGHKEPMPDVIPPVPDEPAPDVPAPTPEPAPQPPR